MLREMKVENTVSEEGSIITVPAVNSLNYCITSYFAKVKSTLISETKTRNRPFLACKLKMPRRPFLAGKYQDPGSCQKIPVHWYGTGACHGVFIPPRNLVLRMDNFVFLVLILACEGTSSCKLRSKYGIGGRRW